MMVSAPISKSKGMGSSPGREYSVVFLGKTLQSINQSVNQPYLSSNLQSSTQLLTSSSLLHFITNYNKKNSVLNSQSASLHPGI